jgi:hypothetical protein
VTGVFFVQAFYLPETEYLHWVRTHPVSSDILLIFLDVESFSIWRSSCSIVFIFSIVSYHAWCFLVMEVHFSWIVRAVVLIQESLKCNAGVYEATSHRAYQPCGNCE